MLGALLTTLTVRCAIAAYFVALVLMVRGATRTVSRRWWTAAYLLLVVHVICAFHVHHAWSHAAAYLDTARKTDRLIGLNWGGGIYFNYLLLAVWGLDLVWRWITPASRPETHWMWPVLLHSFVAFMVFNATVVFETGWIRWGTAIAYLGILLLWMVAGVPLVGKHSVTSQALRDP